MIRIWRDRQLLTVSVCAVALTLGGLVTGATSAAAATTVESAVESANTCASVTKSVSVAAEDDRVAAVSRTGLLQAAQVLCHDPDIVAGNSATLRIQVTDNTITADDTTVIAPDSTCTSDVESQLPDTLSTTDITTAVDDLCELNLDMVTTVSAVAGTPGDDSGDPTVLPASFPTSGVPVYQVTAYDTLCGASCTLWYQQISELYFIQYHHWVWHNLKGYNWAYVDCSSNGGTGFTVTVKSCGWRGPNPGYYDNPIEALCEFEVSFIYHGFPISHAHHIGLVDWIDGAISVDYA